jgi:diguanylate cyclase (GGDEF)-like protein
MGRLAVLARISLGLAALTCSILLTLDLVGWMPDDRRATLDARVRLCEVLAMQAFGALENRTLGSFGELLRVTVERDPTILSAGLRSVGGRLMLQTARHEQLWRPVDLERTTPSHVRVPILSNGRAHTTLEVRFSDPETVGWLAALWGRPLLRLMLPLGVFGFAAYLLYMRRTLRHLDPSAVIPARVQVALDVMAEGVFIVDRDDTIVLANAAFGKHLARDPASLLGLHASELGWKGREPEAPAPTMPWIEAIRDARTVRSVTLVLSVDEELREFVVNGCPVLDGWGRAKGAIATFDDITELLSKSEQLAATLAELEKSRDEIRLQNEELQVLATNDPLTGVANRRCFIERFELEFAAARREERPFCCLMLDIDHFKRVNDAHGHAMGDEVIRRIAEGLKSEIPDAESICRYGGEEFCVSLTDLTIEEAVATAERIRRRVEVPGFARVSVTVSLGVSSIEWGAARAADLLNQADEALYTSKRAGRNRVTRWDEREASV